MEGPTAFELVRILSPNHPRRPVDWRWRAVAWHLATGGQLTLNDPATRLVLAFQQALDECARSPDPASAHRQLAERQPACHERRQLRNQPTRRLTCDRLEACLIGGMTIEAASQFCGLACAVGHVYVSMFFDLVDRRNAKAFIRHEVIGWPTCFAHDELDRGALWKFLAWHHGAEFLQIFLAGNYFEVGEGRPGADFLRTLRSVLQDILACLSMVHAKTPIRGARQQLMGMLRDIDQWHEDHPLTDQKAKDAMHILRAMGLANRYGGPAIPPVGLPAVELRLNQQFALKIGLIDQSDLAQVYEDFKFPDSSVPELGPS